MGRFYENGNKPSGSIRAGSLLTSLASQEGVSWVELVICTDVVSKTLPLQADCSEMIPHSSTSERLVQFLVSLTGLYSR